MLGCDPAHGDRAWRARIGLVLQSTSLEPHVTVRAALAVFARLFPRPRSVGEVLELIDLEADADTPIGLLSGGQQRRVDIGLGIVGRPEVLFLDEPTTGLDPAARRRTWAAIEELARDGTTILLSTHYLEEAERLADRLIVLAGGRLVADARADELRARAARTVVRYPLPCDVPVAELPDALAAHVDGRRRELVLRTDDPASVLERLVDWARSRDVDLMGIEVAAAQPRGRLPGAHGAGLRGAGGRGPCLRRARKRGCPRCGGCSLPSWPIRPACSSTRRARSSAAFCCRCCSWPSTAAALTPTRGRRRGSSPASRSWGCSRPRTSRMPARSSSRGRPECSSAGARRRCRPGATSRRASAPPSSWQRRAGRSPSWPAPSPTACASTRVAC